MTTPDTNAGSTPIYTITQKGLMWEITRPATNEECELYDIDKDEMPVSALGIDKSGFALIADEGLVRIVNSHAALVAALERASLYLHAYLDIPPKTPDAVQTLTMIDEALKLAKETK